MQYIKPSPREKKNYDTLPLTTPSVKVLHLPLKILKVAKTK